MKGVTLQLSMFVLAAVCVTLGNRSLAHSEWDLEWLVTLPVRRGTLLVSRIVERSVTNPVGLLALWPVLTVLAWRGGFRWSAPLVGLAFTAPLQVLIAVLQTLADTGLRLSWTPAKLRNLQAALGLLGALLLYAALSMQSSPRSPVFAWVRAAPDWTTSLPTGTAVQALVGITSSSRLMGAGLLVIEIVALVMLGLWILQRQLRFGVVAGGVREPGKRGVELPAAVAPDTQPARKEWLTAIQRRELRLLSRDRNFMIQTLVLPAVIIGAQYVLRGGSNVFALSTQSANIAAIAFGLAAYALMFSAFQTLNSEGGALWILYTLPKTLAQVLREKAMLWGSITLVYPIAIFGIALAHTRTVSPEGIALAVIVLVGVAIYSVLATALGVFGSNPLAHDVQQRVHPTYVYLYLLLSSLYVYAIYASTFWQRGAVMILTGALALAMWQKARDELPYLLDPSASPPARVSLADGLIAALIFFVLQALIALLLVGRSHVMTGRKLLIAFSVAGAITYALMRFSYWRQHTTEVPRILGPGVARAALLGLGGGVVAAAVGMLYVRVISQMGWMQDVRTGLPTSDPTMRWWLLPLAVIAAPVFEEFIFRGLVFGGLRRFIGPIVAAVASAAIFAIVHPPVSAMPVFVVGLVTALVYERTKMLLAPMLVHALNNAVVVGFQWNSMHWTQ